MPITRWEKANLKRLHTYHMTTWEKQNNGDSKKRSGCQGLVGKDEVIF
jgi:hypothetical protein